jgi:excisionase family DNA binding protein
MYLNYDQAAKLLAVPIGTLYAWVHHHKVPHIRISARMVRFDRAELVSWLEARRVPGESEPRSA